MCNNEIPKVIHYCWFGRNPKPKNIVKCIQSWQKHCPDYKLIEWNEDNFDVNSIPFTREAYKNKKYAFVSDYARCKILNQFGGVYFDTDVELIGSIDEILKSGQFLGVERSKYCHHQSTDGKKELCINPGLGMGFRANNELLKRVIDVYEHSDFYLPNGELNLTTIVRHFTNILLEEGLKDTGEIEEVMGIKIYPTPYFNPLENATGKLYITDKTVAIHWYDKSWMPKWEVYKSKITRRFHRLFGVNCFDFIRRK